MIEILPITTKNKSHYDYMEKLLEVSFPVEEYREPEKIRKHADTLNQFYCNIILSNKHPIGLINYWDMGDFYYIEHLATDPEKRNNGYGKSILELLTSLLKKPIVLEVEHPTEKIAERRIHFYQRHGFTLWENKYLQPPYRTGQDYLPMYLMVSGKLNPEKDFEEIKSRIYKNVYNI